LVAGVLPGVGIGGDRLPGDRAGQSKTADIAAHEDLLVGRKLMAKAKADQRIDPLRGVRPGESDAGCAVDMQMREVDVDQRIERGVDRYIPVAEATQGIERGEGSLRRTPAVQFVDAAHL